MNYQKAQHCKNVFVRDRKVQKTLQKSREDKV